MLAITFFLIGHIAGFVAPEELSYLSSQVSNRWRQPGIIGDEKRTPCGPWPCANRGDPQIFGQQLAQDVHNLMADFEKVRADVVVLGKQNTKLAREICEKGMLATMEDARVEAAPKKLASFKSKLADSHVESANPR